MKRFSALPAALLLLACLMAACLMAACTQAPEAPSETTDEITATAMITVTVQDQNGDPVAGAAIQMCTADSCLMPAATNADGIVRFSLPPDTYYATVAACPEGYTADPSAKYHLEDDATALTITVTKD